MGHLSSCIGHSYALPFLKGNHIHFHVLTAPRECGTYKRHKLPLDAGEEEEVVTDGLANHEQG